MDVPVRDFDWCSVIIKGTVLRPHETVDSSRVIDAVGHAAAVRFHVLYERGLRDTHPAGDRWIEEIDGLTSDDRHLALHQLHNVAVTERDRRAMTGEFLRSLGVVRSADEWSDHFRQLRGGGATEIIYQPGGSDIVHELEAFAEVARRSTVLTLDQPRGEPTS
jgi:hypothetical protein